MNFLRKLVGKKRRHLRIDVRLPVILEAADGSEIQGWTVDLSESGFRMELPKEANASDIVGGSRSINIRMTLNEGEEPLLAVIEFIWDSRDEETGQHFTGWMISHMVEGQRRLKEFIQETDRTANDG